MEYKIIRIKYSETVITQDYYISIPPHVTDEELLDAAYIFDTSDLFWVQKYVKTTGFCYPHEMGFLLETYFAVEPMDQRKVKHKETYQVLIQDELRDRKGSENADVELTFNALMKFAKTKYWENILQTGIEKGSPQGG